MSRRHLCLSFNPRAVWRREPASCGSGPLGIWRLGIQARLRSRTETMDLNHYRFHAEWTVDADCRTVYEALKDLGSYASWWPEVKSVVPLSATRAAVLIMGLLPYCLEFVLEQQIDDEKAGTLKASLVGDLQGWSSWRVRDRGSGSGCSLIYDQEVVVQKRLLRALAPVARPVFKLNHALMMRRGHRGLQRHLAGPR